MKWWQLGLVLGLSLLGVILMALVLAQMQEILHSTQHHTQKLSEILEYNGYHIRYSLPPSRKPSVH